MNKQCTQNSRGTYNIWKMYFNSAENAVEES